MGITLTPLISQQAIANAVQRLAQSIDQDYAGRSLIVVGVLKGSFIFLADLIRQMQTPIQRVELICLSSYGTQTTSSGQVRVLMDLPPELIAGRDVLLVEDIVDTGRSPSAALKLLEACQPASLKLCALLDKPSRRVVPTTIDYLGLTVPDHFIVGYGLDMDEQYRQLSGIYTVEP
ncbi:MAG TPA: hypoxanthine phosphoribosyltransferase [Leptolyngbyaceae cyanobacterium]